MYTVQTWHRKIVSLSAVLAFLAGTSAVAQTMASPVANPYGLLALWAQGDWVSRGTLAFLVLMSVGSWYIGMVKLLEQDRLFKDGQEARSRFWNAPSIEEGMQTLRADSAFRYLADEGIKAACHHKGSQTQAIDLPDWVGMSMQSVYDEIADRLGTGLALLATVGSTAPFVGLFGTVWGIYHALTAIGISGQASIDKVAGPVGEALIMTAIGLAVAVPAVLMYNGLVRRNKTALAQIRQFSSKLQMVLIAGGQPFAKG